MSAVHHPRVLSAAGNRLLRGLMMAERLTNVFSPRKIGQGVQARLGWGRQFQQGLHLML